MRLPPGNSYHLVGRFPHKLHRQCSERVWHHGAEQQAGEDPRVEDVHTSNVSSDAESSEQRKTHESRRTNCKTTRLISTTGKSNSFMVTVSFNLKTPVVASSATAGYCRVRVAAAAVVATVAVVVVAVALAFCGRCSTRCRVFSLPCLICLSVCLFSHFSRSASSARRRASPAPSSSRACSAALLAARQTRRLPLALRMCGPLSTRIHHALCHHVMCLFDTWALLVH